MKIISSKIFSLLLALLFTFSLSSCSKTDPVSTNSGTNNPNIPEYVSGGAQIDDLDIAEPTIETPAFVRNPSDSQSLHNGLHFCKTPQFQFRPIFNHLKLTANQLDSIKEFMEEHFDCERTARETYFKTILVFVENANTQRKAVLDSLQQGLYDRETALQRLNTIYREMHQAIANSGARTTLQNELFACTETLFANIRSILDDKQIVIWDKWVAEQNGPRPGNGWGRWRG
ncbi:MAG TPA: hypothetical protein P5545_04990 [Bacteroidota bacterium]|nr:hypothetical protein [Bacteroidota bacterium]HRT67654.1 hypothetical protein [Bacteroidota bacterium]